MKSKRDENEPFKTPGTFSYSWWMIILLMLFLGPLLLVNLWRVRETTWSTFKTEMLEKHAVEKIVIVNKEVAEVFIRQDRINDPAFKDVLKPAFGTGTSAGPHYQFNIGTIDSFEKKMEESQSGLPETEMVPITYQQRTNWLTDIFSWLIPLFLIIIVFQFLVRSGRGMTGRSSVFNFGQSTARLQEKENRSMTTFEDVAGLEEAKMEVREIVDFLQEPQRYTKLGAKIPKGIIIVGPPGTGKTLLARAVAGEAQVPFFSLSGSEFVEMFVGVGASRVRDLFKRAKERAPSIIFIDEIDAVGRSRGRNAFYSGANDERESTLNQLLTEMDGFGTNSGVIVLAATNRADILDPALLRPGRFDRHIYLELPNQKEREAIFKVHLKPLALAEGVSTEFLASQTPGFSGADISNVCNESALIAARGRKEKVEKQDFLDAMDRIVAGLEKKSKIITPAERRTIAYHEAGHTVVSWVLKHTDPLMKVSIIPRGKSLGAAWYLPEEHQLKTKTEFVEKICSALAGRVAEDITFGEISSGALDDLEKVTKEAYSMITFFGFNPKIGNVSFYDSSGRQEFQKPYSEATGMLIDEEVRNLIEDAYQQTKQILLENREGLIAVAELLLEKEVIFKEDIERILGKRVPA